jgi:hypothetical protein
MLSSKTDEKGVVGAKAPGQRVPQGRQLRSELTAGEIGEHGGVGRPRPERLQHGPAGNAQDIIGDRRQLDAGILEDLV